MLDRLLARYPQARPRCRDVVQFLSADPAWRRFAERLVIDSERVFALRGEMSPTDCEPFVSREADLPRLTDCRELANYLAVSMAELAWLADVRGIAARAASNRLPHYRHTWRRKPSGAPRLIEAPKARLKVIQQRILREILDLIPPHDAAHGFRRGRSIVTFAKRHLDRALVLRLDLRDFFATISAARVERIFMALGYPETVAVVLTGLATSIVPVDVLDVGLAFADRGVRWRLTDLLRRRHLPQGSPTSPALANLATWGLDARLAGLAHAHEGAYSRYADDLVLSGGAEFARSARWLRDMACAIVEDEGFSVAYHKTRLLPASQRQRIAGVLVNKVANVERGEFDRLKATLMNCIRRGAEEQNREHHGDFRSHLLGRVAFVSSVNPRRGQRLRKLFDAIDWARASD